MSGLRMAGMLELVEDAGDELRNADEADEAERRVIEEVRQLGAELLGDWAEGQVEKRAQELEQTPGSGARVKKLTWHSIFGDIGVDEPQYRQGNVRRRPFISGAGVQSRGCSLALQRAVTDLGADLPFAQAAQKLREHYGVDLSACTIRRITERHAGELVADEDAEPAWPTQPGVAAVIAEIDGGMVPLAQSDPESADRRRGKRVFWKEAKLSLAHAHGSTERTYGATLNGGVEVAGRQLLSCAPSPPVWAPTPGCMRWATGPCGSPTRWGRALRHAGALFGGFLSRL